MERAAKLSVVPEMPDPPETASIHPNAQFAADLLLRSAGPRQEEDPDHDIYEVRQPQIDTHDIKVEKPSVNVLHMNELLVGHQDAATDFFKRTVDQIAELPDEMKPDVALLSGFLMGDFKYLQKSRRSTLKPKYNSMDVQFKRARDMIETVQEAGVPVIYNMSNDDHRIAEEYTVEVFKNMHKLAKEAGGSKSPLGLNVSAMDKMRQHPEWNTHLQFQIETVFPHCLRTGRRLHTGAEMEELTNGAIDIDEYFVLFAAAEAKKSGTEVPETHQEWLKAVEANQNSEIVITDDVNLHITTEGREYTDWIRHYFGFSPEPMYQNHLEAPVSALSQLGARDEAVPDMLITQHNQEEVGVDLGGTWVASKGGMIRARNVLNRPARETDARGDISRRLATTRRRIPEPTVTTHERTDDGRHIISIYNDKLQEKNQGERSTVAMMVDWQTGSPTARPDLQAKFMDYVFSTVLPERPMHLFWNGDMLQGRNYPDFPNESESQGLISMSAQERFVKELVALGISAVNPEDARNLRTVDVTVGNHEWNSGTTKWHGYTFSSFLRQMFETEFPEAVVKEAQALVTPTGDYFRASVAAQQVNDYGVLIQHMPLERGAKGASGPPIYQAGQLFNGGGDLFKNIDVAEFGHWHHPQYAMFGNKLAVISGSLAGLSGYEYMRGYRPVLGGALVHLSGGLPVQLEFVPEKALNSYDIKGGEFAAAALHKQGYKDDRGFDAARHGIFVPRAPKSALQKKVLDMMREASQRTSSLTELW